MRIVKVGLAILGVASLLVLAGGTPEAFHSGGVAECAGCHSMHSPKPGGSFLLTGIDASSTCLNCHQVDTDTGPSRYHISTPSSKRQGRPWCTVCAASVAPNRCDWRLG